MDIHNFPILTGVDVQKNGTRFAVVGAGEPGFSPRMKDIFLSLCDDLSKNIAPISFECIGTPYMKDILDTVMDDSMTEIVITKPVSQPTICFDPVIYQLDKFLKDKPEIENKLAHYRIAKGEKV